MKRKRKPQSDVCPTCKGTGKRPPETRGRRFVLDLDQLAAAVALGLTKSQLAKHFGVTRQTIYTSLERMQKREAGL